LQFCHFLWKTLSIKPTTDF